jgi:hypothetical protein
MAQPKSSTGANCTKSGSERHVGTGSDGKKYDCMMDFCTYCGVTSGTIDCSHLITEWSNATDCKPAAKVSVNQSLFNKNVFDESLNFDSGTPNHGGATNPSTQTAPASPKSDPPVGGGGVIF